MAIGLYGIENANIASGAAIKASKLEGEYTHDYSQTGTVAAGTAYFGPIKGSAATLLSFSATITETIATGGDRTVTITLLKSTGGGAFASVLSAAIVLDTGNVLYIPEVATINTTSAVAGDMYKITVAVAGAAGNQALGLCVSTRWREDAP